MDFITIATEARRTRNCHQDINELASLLGLIYTQKPEVYVEIGTYYAGGTWAVQQVVPDTKIICIDNSSLDTNIIAKGSLERNKVNATLIAADSTLESTAEELKKCIDHIDFLFIDGNHEYKAVKKDYELYSPLVRSGGIVALHDIMPHQAIEEVNVEKLWLEIKDKHKTSEIHSGIGWGGVGLIWK